MTTTKSVDSRLRCTWVAQPSARRLRDSSALARSVVSRARGVRRLPNRLSLAVQRGARPQRGAERLRPGDMDWLVLDYLRRHATRDSLAPVAGAKGLAQSSVAVGNLPGPARCRWGSASGRQAPASATGHINGSELVAKTP
jgi:hypothetical protein